MTPIEAYELTLEKIEELKISGIEIKINPCELRNNKELIKEYDNLENIPPDKWINVAFINLDKIKSMKVHETSKYLGMCGITFDSGGSPGYRDWELDWSFQYTGKNDECERDIRDEVENMINEIEEREKIKLN